MPELVPMVTPPGGPSFHVPTWREHKALLAEVERLRETLDEVLATLAHDNPHLQAILDNDKHDGGAGGPCLRCPSCEGGHPIGRPGGREACIGCGHERCKEGGPSPRPILEDS